MSAPPAHPTREPSGPVVSDLTVVVTADDVDGRAVRDLARQWRADGLIGDVAWVTPTEVERGPYSPPVIRAQVVGHDGTVELMSFLGMRPRSLIRVVLLHLLTHEMSDPETLVETCEEIAELVNRSRARTVDADGRHRVSQLLRVNLMVPESDLLPQDPRIILPAWEVNAVVSPEDRPELDRQSVFVRRSTNLYGHALAAAATVGGLWCETDGGVFDNLEADSTTGGGEIVVIRCQVRVVVAHDGVPQLGRCVIEALESSPTGASAWVPWATPAANPAAWVRSCTELLMTHPDWTPLEREPEPWRQEQTSFGEELRSWVWFQLLLVPAVFHLLFGWGRAVVERRVTALTVGADGEAQAHTRRRTRPLPPEAVTRIADARMKLVEDELRPARLEEEAAAWGRTTPEAWRELRELAIGLVDGGRLSARFSRAGHGGAVEVVAPGYVVGAPDDRYELWSGQRIGPVDVELAAAALHELEQAREADERARRRTVESGVLAGRRARVAPATDAGARPRGTALRSPGPPVDGATTGPQPASATEPPRPPVPSTTTDATTGATSAAGGRPPGSDGSDDRPERSAAVVTETAEDPTGPDDADHPEELLAWLEQRRSTLMWQLTARALDLRDRERDRAERAHRAVAEAKPPATDKLESARSFLVLCWGLALTALGVVATLNALSLLRDPVEFVTSLTDLLSGDAVRVVVVVIAVLLGAGTMYFQAMRSFDRAVTQRLHALTRASEDYVTSRHQERRWELMHRGLIDWADVFSELLHRPWATPTPPALDRLPAYGGLPASVGVAVPAPEQDEPDSGFISRAVETVCQKGWLSAELARVLDASPANDPRHRDAGGTEGQRGDLPADLDLGLRARGPRRELVQVAARDQTKQAATQAMLDSVSGLLRRSDVRVPARTVMRVGYYSQGETTSDRDFLTPRDQVAPLVTEVFAPRAQLEQLQVPERAVLVLPPGIEVPPRFRARHRTSVLPGPGTTMLRVDLSSVMGHDNISLFHRVPRPEHRPPTSPDDFN